MHSCKSVLSFWAEVGCIQEAETLLCYLAIVGSWFVLGLRASAAGKQSRGNPSSCSLVRVEQRAVRVQPACRERHGQRSVPARRHGCCSAGRGAGIPAVLQVLCRLLLICKKNRHLPRVEERLSFPPSTQGLDPCVLCFTARHLLCQTLWAPACLRMLRVLAIHSHTFLGAK